MIKWIKKYIQFAIDNWLKNEEFGDEYEGIESIEDNEINFYVCQWIITINIIKLITSKEFIEARARWIYNLPDMLCSIDILIKEITIEQKIAIRDWYLQEYIDTHNF